MIKRKKIEYKPNLSIDRDWELHKYRQVTQSVRVPF